MKTHKKRELQVGSYTVYTYNYTQTLLSIRTCNRSLCMCTSRCVRVWMRARFEKAADRDRDRERESNRYYIGKHVDVDMTNAWNMIECQ